jgi:hypothetical protein
MAVSLDGGDPGVPMSHSSKVVPTNLMALSLEGIDVILGMD